MTMAEKVLRAARKVVRNNLRKAAVLAHDAELDFRSVKLLPREIATEVRILAQLKEKRAEKLLRHAALIAANFGISSKRVSGQANVAPVMLFKRKGRGGHPGPSAVKNDTQPTVRRVASAI